MDDDVVRWKHAMQRLGLYKSPEEAWDTGADVEGVPDPDDPLTLVLIMHALWQRRHFIAIGAGRLMELIYVEDNGDEFVACEVEMHGDDFVETVYEAVMEAFGQ